MQLLLILSQCLPHFLSLSFPLSSHLSGSALFTVATTTMRAAFASAAGCDCQPSRPNQTQVVSGVFSQCLPLFLLSLSLSLLKPFLATSATVLFFSLSVSDSVFASLSAEDHTSLSLPLAISLCLSIYPSLSKYFYQPELQTHLCLCLRLCFTLYFSLSLSFCLPLSVSLFNSIPLPFSHSPPATPLSQSAQN